MESRVYSWARIAASRRLSPGPCELVFAFLSSDGQTTGKAVIYDGENANGDMVVTLESIANSGTPFSPQTPVYCRRGLYVTFTTGNAIFIQWRVLSHEKGGG